MRAIRGTAIRVLLSACLLVAASGAGGCTVHEHTVGLGPNGLGTESARQFYLLFGWLRLNEVDSQRMAQDATSYRVTSERSFVDYLLTPLLILTVSTRTVTVER